MRLESPAQNGTHLIVNNTYAYYSSCTVYAHYHPDTNWNDLEITCEKGVCSVVQTDTSVINVEFLKIAGSHIDLNILKLNATKVEVKVR